MSSYISLPIYAASIGARLRLEAGRCTRCATLNYPPRTVCTACGNAAFTTETLSGRGSVYTFTRIAGGGAPAEFDDQQTMTGEIVVAIVALEEGPHVIGQLTDLGAEGIEIGTPVEAVMRRLYDQEGIVRYGLKFRPCMNTTE